MISLSVSQFQKFRQVKYKSNRYKDKNNLCLKGLILNVNITDKPMNIIAIIRTESPLNFPKVGTHLSGRTHRISIFRVLPASPAERWRLASCDSDAAQAISIGRYNEWANRRESIGFCNQRPESLVWPARASLYRSRRQSRRHSCHSGTARYTP